MRIMHPGPCISCITTQNTSHSQLSQYLRSAIHTNLKNTYSLLYGFCRNSYIPNQTGISEIFRAHSLRRLLVVPRLVWGESVWCEWEGKGREERVKRWFLKQAGCESLSVSAATDTGQRQCELPGQPRHPQHTHVTGSQSPLAAILGADLTFTLSTFTSQRMPWDHHLRPLWHLEEDNCSWHICGWAPTLDKDYCRYKSWTMAPLLTQN